MFFFFIEDAELLEKYNKIWDKVSNSVKKDFNSKPIANEKYLKPYEGKINTNFHGKGIPKEGSHCIYSSVILIALFENCKNHYLQVFLEECKHIAKEKKVKRYIKESFSDGSDKQISDKERLGV